MYDDMRHFVVFRVPETLWENHDELNGSHFDDWIRQNTIEGAACVTIGETDFRHHYLIVGFTTPADAHVFREYVRSLEQVEIAFDSAAD